MHINNTAILYFKYNIFNLDAIFLHFNNDTFIMKFIRQFHHITDRPSCPIPFNYYQYAIGPVALAIHLRSCIIKSNAAIKQ